MPDEQLMREYIKAVKEEKRMRRGEPLKKILSMAGKAFPKGIRHPDSLVSNLHLYVPGRRGRTRLH
jgi:hypothetical protein